MISDSINITIPSDASLQNSVFTNPQNTKLYETAREFEAVFTATMLKQGLKSASQMSDKDSGNSSYMDFAYDQLGNYLGRQGILGIADSIYKQMIEFDQGERQNVTP